MSHPSRPDPATLRAEFAADLDVVPWRWSGHTIARLIRSTGEWPARLAEIRHALFWLGLGDCRRYPSRGGAFDHGTLWGRSRAPLWIVGHPYHITADQIALLVHLAVTFPTLTVAVDDRPSFYGFGTRHVRVGVPEPRRPFDRTQPLSTRWTRGRARAARRAFAEAGLAAWPPPAAAARGVPCP